MRHSQIMIWTLSIRTPKYYESNVSCKGSQCHHDKFVVWHIPIIGNNKKVTLYFRRAADGKAQSHSVATYHSTLSSHTRLSARLLFTCGSKVEYGKYPDIRSTIRIRMEQTNSGKQHRRQRHDQIIIITCYVFHQWNTRCATYMHGMNVCVLHCASTRLHNMKSDLFWVR